MISTSVAFFSIASSMIPRSALSISVPLLKMSCRSSLSFTGAILFGADGPMAAHAEPGLDAVQRVDVVAVPLHRGGQAQVRQGLPEPAGTFEGTAQHVMGVVVGRIVLDQCPQLRLRACELGGVEVGTGQQQAYGGVARLRLDDGLEQPRRAEGVAGL